MKYWVRKINLNQTDFIFGKPLESVQSFAACYVMDFLPDWYLHNWDLYNTNWAFKIDRDRMNS